MWYRVTYKPCWFAGRFSNHIQALTAHEALEQVMSGLNLTTNLDGTPTYSDFRVTVDPYYPQREAKKELWAGYWQRAHVNMPYINKRRSGQALALVTLLGYIPNKKHNAGMFVRAMKERGSKPKNPQVADKLQKLAGPYGTIFAVEGLNELGLGKRFKYNPLQK